MAFYTYADVYDCIRRKIDFLPDRSVDELTTTFFEKYDPTDDKLEETVDSFLDSVLKDWR